MIKGWIVDIYPDYEKDEIVLWLKQPDGRVIRFTEPFTPSFYVSASAHDLNALMHDFAFSPLLCAVSYEHEQQLITGAKPRSLLRVEVPRYKELKPLVAQISRQGAFSRFRLYNADINFALRYLFTRGLAPLTLLSLNSRGNGSAFNHLEDPSSCFYETPPLREARLSLEINKQGALPKAGDPLGKVILECEGETVVLEGSEGDILIDLKEEMSKLDPDVLYSDKRGGDELTYLYRRAGAAGVAHGFWLGREPEKTPEKKGRTYYSYGRVIYKPPSYSLRGRVFIEKNSFLYSESGLHGLVDLSRFARVPMQMLARMSPGNAITTMQLRYCFENKILIPWKQQNPERFKTAWKLLYSDRGGYIFDPQVGLFDDTAELDFASMYPNIMVRYNVSPETLLCRCCRRTRPNRVPVLDYHTCERHVGLVPKVLEPLIRRRFHFKDMAKKTTGSESRDYRQRQSILKWLLITSFGYQGYRNARFGRIECHETICAYGRELLLRAKELVEYFGFEVLHGLVDSLWIRRRASVEELLELCEAISCDIGIDINLEGRYRWIVFLPNKSNHVGALNRYYGVFEDGSIKARGIELRMRNTPPFLKRFQRDALEVLRGARGAGDFHAYLRMALKVMQDYGDQILRGDLDGEDLVFRVGVSRSLGEYRVRNAVYAALRQLAEEGHHLQPGQSLSYIVTDNSSRSWQDKVCIAESYENGQGYDEGYYLAQLVKAAESLFLPFGYAKDRLHEALTGRFQASLSDFGSLTY